jgi:hypothetical protein
MRSHVPKIVAALFGTLAAIAQAQVVSDTNVLISPTALHNANFMVTVLQEPSRNETGIFLKKTDNAVSGLSTITPVTWTVDEEADFYLINKGDVLTSATIAAGNFKPLFTTDHPYSLDVGLNDKFYLGIVTGLGGVAGVGPNRNIFGWAEFQNSATGLTILHSAMAYGYSGIVGGTITAVPELDTSALLGFGLISLALLRRSSKGVRQDA